MKKLFLVGLGAVALSGCAQGPKYEWGSYQHAMLAYYRTPAQRADFDKALDDTIAKGEVQGRVPPGMYAEAGYEAMSQGNNQKAVDLFAKEKAAWPESAVFMEKASSGAGKSAPVARAATPAS